MISHMDQQSNKKQINRLHASKLTKVSNADNRKYMDDYFARVFVEPEQHNQIMPLIVKV